MLRAYLREAIDIAPDPRVRWQALMRYAQQGGYISRDLSTATESARDALRIAGELGDPPMIAAATAALAYYEAFRGHHGIEFGVADHVLDRRISARETRGQEMRFGECRRPDGIRGRVLRDGRSKEL